MTLISKTATHQVAPTLHQSGTMLWNHTLLLFLPYSVLQGSSCVIVMAPDLCHKHPLCVLVPPSGTGSPVWPVWPCKLGAPRQICIHMHIHLSYTLSVYIQLFKNLQLSIFVKCTFESSQATMGWCQKSESMCTSVFLVKKMAGAGKCLCQLFLGHCCHECKMSNLHHSLVLKSVHLNEWCVTRAICNTDWFHVFQKRLVFINDDFEEESKGWCCPEIEIHDNKSAVNRASYTGILGCPKLRDRSNRAGRVNDKC